MKEKILSICLPTYNRSKCINEQLKRLSTLDNKTLEKIEIIVSDNCSPDDTQEVILSYKERLDLKYNRNNINIGPDGNYIYCFTHATGKYIWLVGDDDYLVPDNLTVVIDTLKDKDYGFLYINPDAKDYLKPSVVEYTDKESFFSEMGIMLTFLTSSIVRKDYINDVDILKYKGSYQEYVPFFVTSILRGNINAELYFKIFEYPAMLATNGGYNVFEVFVTNYLKIIKDFYDKKMISGRLYRKEVQFSKDFILPSYLRYVILKQKSNFKLDNARNILLTHFGVWGTYYALLKFILITLLQKIKRRLKTF